MKKEDKGKDLIDHTIDSVWAIFELLLSLVVKVFLAVFNFAFKKIFKSRDVENSALSKDGNRISSIHKRGN